MQKTGQTLSQNSALKTQAEDHSRHLKSYREGVVWISVHFMFKVVQNWHGQGDNSYGKHTCYAQ